MFTRLKEKGQNLAYSRLRVLNMRCRSIILLSSSAFHLVYTPLLSAQRGSLVSACSTQWKFPFPGVCEDAQQLLSIFHLHCARQPSRVINIALEYLLVRRQCRMFSKVSTSSPQDRGSELTKSNPQDRGTELT